MTRRRTLLVALGVVVLLTVAVTVVVRADAPDRARIDRVDDAPQVTAVLDLGRTLALRVHGAVVLVDPAGADVVARVPTAVDAVVRGAGTRGFFVVRGSEVARHDVSGRLRWRIEVGTEPDVVAATTTHALLRSCGTGTRTCVEIGVDASGDTVLRRRVGQDDGRVQDVDGVVPEVAVSTVPAGQPSDLDVVVADPATGAELGRTTGDVASVAGHDVVVESGDRVETLRDGRRLWERAGSDEVGVSRGLVVVTRAPRLVAYDLDTGRATTWEIDEPPAKDGSSLAFAGVARGAVVTEDDDGVVVVRALGDGDDTALEVPSGVDGVDVGGGVATIASASWWRRLSGDDDRVVRLIDARDGSATAEVQVADEPWVVHAVRRDVAVLSGPSTFLVRAR